MPVATFGVDVIPLIETIGITILRCLIRRHMAVRGMMMVVMMATRAAVMVMVAMTMLVLLFLFFVLVHLMLDKLSCQCTGSCTTSCMAIMATSEATNGTA